ncbi:unnamed protein product [Calypogeia fissa]
MKEIRARERSLEAERAAVGPVAGPRQWANNAFRTAMRQAGQQSHICFAGEFRGETVPVKRRNMQSANRTEPDIRAE